MNVTTITPTPLPASGESGRETNCPCGSKKAYTNCCGLFIDAEQIPATPEALMRSRYTAYSQANISYIEKTMRGRASENYNSEQAFQWAKHAVWLGLTVLNTHIDPKNPERGFVEFIARYQINNKPQQIHELSEFHRYDGQWFYVNGKSAQTTQAKVGRNDNCPCGSSKKYKKCCRH